MQRSYVTNTEPTKEERKKVTQGPRPMSLIGYKFNLQQHNGQSLFVFVLLSSSQCTVTTLKGFFFFLLAIWNLQPDRLQLEFCFSFPSFCLLRFLAVLWCSSSLTICWGTSRQIHSPESNSHLQGSVTLFPFNIFLPVLTLSSSACTGASLLQRFIFTCS